MKNKSMFQSPIIFITIGLVICLAILMIIDFGLTIYNPEKFKKDSLEIAELLCGKEYLDDEKQITEYLKGKYEDMGYSTDYMSVHINPNGSIIIYNTDTYWTMKTILLNQKEKFIELHLIVYKNEYNEWIAEEYDENKEYPVNDGGTTRVTTSQVTYHTTTTEPTY